MAFASAPRTALITGAARRIGAAIARDLAAHGWGVAIHYNSSRDDAEALVAEIGASGGRAVAVKADLSDLAALPGLVDAAAVGLGPIGLLVNNASEFEPDEIGALDVARLERHLTVDLASPCLLADAWLARLPEDVHGHVINIVDQRVWRLTPRFFSYTLAKTALWTATRTMAQALAPRIRVNAIGPGPSFANPRQTAEDFARQTDAVPLGRGPAPEEFGRTVRYFVDTASVTGQMICLDGGQHLAWETPDVVGVGE
ncbi:SDR family oxidoreductase [Pinisolibacter sp.]|uniref:SDR family oxidoreductase n=1 Tax=Pinisolibacter sp. TaxID=2172024 RepID=UPI002FDC7E62